MRTCTQCGVAKEIEQFYKDSRLKSGYGSKCRPCLNSNMKAWYRRTKAEPRWAAKSNKCSDCGIEKTSENSRKIRRLSRFPDTYGGFATKCRECENVQQRKRYSPEKRRWRGRTDTYKRVYGITVAEYDALLLQQKGKCAICGNECPSKRRLAIDHDHATGKIRGLLCVMCNTAIGSFKDDLSLISKAYEYLKSRSLREVA